MSSIAERIRRFREAPPRSLTERCARPPAPAPARLPRWMLGEGMTLEDLHQHPARTHPLPSLSLQDPRPRGSSTTTTSSWAFSPARLAAARPHRRAAKGGAFASGLC